ncbi:cache domain-containing sensor histidine kinase [Cohnella zeiphila]|uniref:histidine kinase n=1 Tax=Cohnella zeiphila TaxID=2761120 RepID=A0A7X0SM24_9BACL|nr:sensor histidine kinase [Cohnella zeiphila]MBB6731190.1 sensor histidine kinase [Cohnella zeiphila]
MRRWLESYRHLKIRHKLSILIALIILVTFAFSLLVQQYAFATYDQQLYAKSAQVLNLSSSAIETELKRIQQVSYSIIADTQVQKGLQSIMSSDSEYDRYLLRKDFVDHLITYAGSETAVLSVQVFDALGVKNEVGNVFPTSAARAARIRELALEAKGDSRWILPSEDDPALTLVREIRSFSKQNIDLENIGTLVVRIDLESIIQKYVNPSGDLIILSGGNVLYPLQPEINPAALAGSSVAAKSYFTETYDDKTYFISRILSANTGWTYLNITPFNDIFKKVVFLKELVVGVFIALFAFVIFWGIRFSRSLTRPIEDLMSRMKLAERGNFAEANLLPAGDSPVAMDEIGLLRRTFRLMIERIQALITENYESRLLIKETEFKALQAQINPHFLYNTLESINWLAKVNRQEQISSMVESLGFLLRSSISLKEPMLTLADEVEIVRSYVTIQKYRFEERLDFHLSIPQDHLARKLPKLALQPLLENAIHYALEPSVGPCRIAIRSWETDDELLIAVEDSGPGIAADTLNRLRSGELTAKGKGIGLLNIDERIKLAFGDKYGIRLDNQPEGGARIALALPRETEDNAHVQSAAC